MLEEGPDRRQGKRQDKELGDWGIWVQMVKWGGEKDIEFIYI